MNPDTNPPVPPITGIHAAAMLPAPRFALANRTHGWFELLENNVATGVIGPEAHMLAVVNALNNQHAYLTKQHLRSLN